MPLPIRVVLVLAYHGLLVLQIVLTANSPTEEMPILPILGGGAIGLFLVLQASAKLPALFHGFALFGLIPGLVFLAGPGFSSTIESLMTTEQAVVVTQASDHVYQIGGTSNLPSRTGTYTVVEATLPSGVPVHGFIRPAQHLRKHDTIILDVDSTGVIRPQRDAVRAPLVVEISATLAGLLVECELVSALVRPKQDAVILAYANRTQDK